MMAESDIPKLASPFAHSTGTNTASCSSLGHRGKYCGTRVYSSTAVRIELVSSRSEHIFTSAHIFALASRRATPSV